MELTLKSEILSLLENGLTGSAEIVSSLLLSNNANDADCLELHADTLFAKQEYMRSLDFYMKAFNNRKQSSQPKVHRITKTIDNEDDARLRYKECQCRIFLKDLSVALRELEAIPQKYRDVKINTALAKLYKSNGLRRHAVTCFKEALYQAPMAIEVIEALLSLSVPSSDILSIIDEIRMKNTAYSTLLGNNWISNVVVALASRYEADFKQSELAFKGCLQMFPGNMYLLGQLGRTAVDAEQPEEALVVYRQMRDIDDKVVDGMDMLGYLLQQREDIHALNKLASDLLAIDQKKAHGWIVASMYSELKGDQEKALTFVDKAIQLDPRHALSFRLKGQLLLARQRPEQAVISFFQASSIEKDVATLSGLVQAHQALHKTSEAMAAAKEAITLQPRSPTAMVLYASVLASMKDGHKEAARLLRKVVLQTPTNKGAISSLAVLLAVQGKHEEAISCLLTALERKPCPQLRIQLGKLLSRVGRHVDALAQLNTAANQSVGTVDHAEALQELERVERILKGEEVSDREDDSSIGGIVTASGRRLSGA